MHIQEKAIVEIDQAALGLIRALEKYAYELECCVDMEHLQSIRLELINLRKILLGLEMGAFYQKEDYDDEVLTEAVKNEQSTVDKVAAKVLQQLNQRNKE